MGTALIAAALGAGVLAGWAFHIQPLKSVLPDLVTMKANTALAFLLSGVSLFLLQQHNGPRAHKAGRVLACLVAAIGIGTLLEYLFHVDLAIDQVLFPEDRGAVATSHPGRMAPNTAVCFALAGAALLMVNTTYRGRSRPTEYLSMAIICIALLAVTSYVLGAKPQVGLLPAATLMALHTAIGLVILAIGLIAARPKEGWMRIVTNTGSAGMLMRWLLPIVVLILISLGWARLLGERAGIYTSEVGTSLFVVIRIILIGAGIFWAARIIAGTEQARDRLQNDLVTLNAELEQRISSRTAIIQRAHRELQEERDFTATVLDVTRALVVVLDREGRVVRFNAACEQMTGYRAAEVMGRPFWNIFLVPEEVAGVREVFSRLKAGDFPLDYENYWVTKSGERRLISWSNSCIAAPDGLVMHVIGTGIDITDRRRAENEIIALNAELEQRVEKRTRDLELALRRLRESNQELEQFAYVASHDLQEPLRKLTAFSSMLIEECGQAIPDRGHDYLQRIGSAVTRMQTLINDLLALSRVTVRPRAPTRVDLGLIAREVLADLESRVRETGAQVVVGDLPAIEADPLQMRQLLQNLIGNALKFHRKDCPPQVNISYEPLRGPAGPMVRIFVRDNGIGFDNQYAERIFGVFQRLHSRDAYEGTGIGLAICRKIAARHGGTIVARSTPGEGSTFIVELPVSAPPDDAYVEAAGEDASAGGSM